jgi:hypothetical protein
MPTFIYIIENTRDILMVELCGIHKYKVLRETDNYWIVAMRDGEVRLPKNRIGLCTSKESLLCKLRTMKDNQLAATVKKLKALQASQTIPVHTVPFGDEKVVKGSVTIL